jgi:hypothetical protein
MANPAFKLARELLDGGASDLRELQIHEFADDSEVHDDALQARIVKKFEAQFDQAHRDLTRKFGDAIRTGTADDPGIPLTGVFRCAVWDVEGRELFLAAAHEDRETPVLLMMGVEAGNA